jgi:hypothetical protein
MRFALRAGGGGAQADDMRLIRRYLDRAEFQKRLTHFKSKKEFRNAENSIQK